MLYQAYQLQSDLVAPLRLAAQYLSAALWFEQTERSFVRKVSAACDVLARLRLTHARPPYNIHSAMVDGREVPVVEETVLSLPFGSLLRFRKADT
ncbi:MAG: polyhydroxyalkanoate depolymerase, partial [Hydrogenophaga sp.]|nr:polyhydroxyalkanoate depolymerase [Hydrogenophaga sp.]